MSKNFKQFSKAIWEKHEVVEEENKPTNPELWARAKSMAKKKFDVYPSAYANGWASKWYKSKGGGWKSVSEAVEPEKKDEYDGEVDMAKNQLKRIISHAQHFHDMLKDKDQNLPEWVQSKVTKAEDYISSAHDYMMGEMNEATYTAVHVKHGKTTVQADSTYGAAKKAASQWNTGKKGTQGIDVHLHTDKPKAYTEAVVRLDPKSFLKVKGPSSAYDAGYAAAKSGKKYGENPHPKGSKEHLDWSKAHNQARVNKIHGEEVDLEEGHFEITYTNPQFSKPQKHTMKAKSADHAQTKFLSYGNPYKVHSVKKVQKEEALDESSAWKDQFADRYHDIKGHKNPEAQKHIKQSLSAYDKGDYEAAHHHMSKAENIKEESLNEISKKTLASYVHHAAHDAGIKRIMSTDFYHQGDKAKKQINKDASYSLALKYGAKARKRIDNIGKAAQKLAKEAFIHPDHQKELDDPKTSPSRLKYLKNLINSKKDSNDDHEAWKEKRQAALQGRHYHEEKEVPALCKSFKAFDEGYYKDIATNKAEDERLAKQKKTNYPPHMAELLKKARIYDKKHPLPKTKNESVEEGVTGAVAGGVLGAMTGGPVGAIAGGYLGHKVQQAANKKKKNEQVEESAASRFLKHLKDIEQRKNWAANLKVPDYSQTPKKEPLVLGKVKTVKEAYKNAKKKKIKPETFEAEPELNSDVQLKGTDNQ